MSMTTPDTIATANTRELTIRRGVREYVENVPAWLTTPASIRDADMREVTA